ncbi:hypothetical protein GOB46_21010 [Sinorhizobium meliloti]|uniref:hypothetical protein n=1 Tax=Rhizobium meliloti TaxID=382 RepID=UPI000FD5BF12|nr:hypothetical protein [Sinorhizobium meliloti]MDW9818199.1 hypothetical protein [Sinorhizobium meliloti]MDW9855039.1 hypothetical protein [Sinorhizobium meliloti]MDW9872685.1 hypothetical protein [Sinorhizobium meliloti]MDW9886346.1 hypothetical protein [Sinorhizobium meliloti]MDX0208228.1 hypothetical protein [Sinorhizobium meliloti]
MMPQLATLPVGHDAATRRERASAVPVAALRGHDLTVAERSALLDCYATPDRTFLEIATTHGVDRERLQELWFDLFLFPSRR